MGVCLFLDDFIYLQIQLVNLSNLGMLIYQGNNKPFQGKFRNVSENFNEFIIFICFLHVFLFTDFVGDKSMQYNLGYSLMTVIGVFLTFHLTIILLVTLKFVKLIFVRYKRRIKHWYDNFNNFG